MKEVGVKMKVIAAAVLTIGAVACASILTGCGGDGSGTAEAATLTNTSKGEMVNRIDLLRGDAPELAAYGDQKIGVRTLQLVNPNQIDVVKIDQAVPLPDPLPRYDRPLKIEVWYPADANATGSNQITAMLRDASFVTLQGKAIQDAAPVKSGGSFPLVIISHGYPGNRHLLSPIAENMASKGYVVVSIDHTDSTYNTLSANGAHSALVNRPLDQLFVLNQIASLSKDPNSFLYGLADTNNTAIMGYSMGGYGTLVTAGAGVTQTIVNKYPLLAMHQSGSESHNNMWDPRVKTAVTFAPYGLKAGIFDTTTLKGIKVPMLFVNGSSDTTVGYEDGAKANWKAVIGVDRNMLTFENAGHNVGAPMSPPIEAYKYDATLKMYLTNHYADQIWDNLRMNNLSTHFVTAWLGKHLKSNTDMDAYMDLVPVGSEGVWAVDANGVNLSTHTYWKGFPNGTARGLRYEKLKAGE